MILSSVYRYVTKLHCHRLRTDDRHLQERNKLLEIELAKYVGSSVGHHSVPQYTLRYTKMKDICNLCLVFPVYVRFICFECILLGFSANIPNNNNLTIQIIKKLLLVLELLQFHYNLKAQVKVSNYSIFYHK